MFKFFFFFFFLLTYSNEFLPPNYNCKELCPGKGGVLMSHMYTSCVAVWKKLRSKSYVIINNEPSDKKTSLSSLTAFKDTRDQVSTSHEKKLC